MELIAEGSEAQQRWRIPLEPGTQYVLGREHDGPLVVPWDDHVSRKHVRLTLHRDELHVVRIPTSRNPLLFDGRDVTECNVRVGQHFVLGSTCFRLAGPRLDAASPAAPIEEMAFSRRALQEVRFRDPDKRIEVLSHLPDVIWGARTDSDFFLRLVNLILGGIPSAEAAAIVAWADGTFRILHWDRRHEAEGELRPSARLIHEAIQHRRESVLHVWESTSPAAMEYTAMMDLDWAFCTPVLGPATQGWGLYVAGRKDREFSPTDLRNSDRLQLQGDIKFAELVAEIISSARRLQQLERQQAGLRQFFAPAVLSAVGENLDTGLLAPRETEVTILFCDLRGFSRRAEVARGDLIGLLDRVSQAMGIMTREILAHGGGIGDFLGDAAMGFWGWPVSSDDAPLDACRAALGIRAAFAAMGEQKNHPLANFEMGIGIAQGKAVAGKIGTSDHVKVTVFGPVVNLASRLESMTKQLRVPILLDEAVAAIARSNSGSGECRTRRLARVLPYGMETPLVVSELLPPETECPQLTDANLQKYEEALDHFLEGRWEEAYHALHALPSTDRAQDFLTVMIMQHNRIVPADWDGVVRLPSK